MTLRPYGIIVSGRLELGQEVLTEGGSIVEIRPHTGKPEPYVLSPAFVNVHSHLEYRGLQDRIEQEEYWPWIRELTKLKLAQQAEQVADSCAVAALENRATGAAAIGEHSDRPYSGSAMRKSGLDGAIFQEVITFFERENRTEKLALVRRNAEANRAHFTRVFMSPHAYHTVDRETLAEIASSGEPFSIHVAETPLESEFTSTGTGKIAEFYRQAEIPFEPTGKNIVATLADLGLLRKEAQFVHCCAIEEDDIELLAKYNVSVAHCPRSNARLRCPVAPVREMLDAGIRVGLGLDSPASSGPIDFFEEMRAARDLARQRGRALAAEEIWRMATDLGAASLPAGLADPWTIAEGSAVPLIKIHIEGVRSTQDLIDQATPKAIEWP